MLMTILEERYCDFQDASRKENRLGDNWSTSPEIIRVISSMTFPNPDLLALEQQKRHAPHPQQDSVRVQRVTEGPDRLETPRPPPDMWNHGLPCAEPGNLHFKSPVDDH